MSQDAESPELRWKDPWMQNPGVGRRGPSIWRLSHISRLTPLPFLRISVIHACNMNFYDYRRVGRPRDWGDSVMGGKGFKTILIFIKICSFGLGFYITLPLPRMPQNIIESVKFLRILRDSLFYKLPNYRDPLCLSKVPTIIQRGHGDSMGRHLFMPSERTCTHWRIPSRTENTSTVQLALKSVRT